MIFMTFVFKYFDFSKKTYIDFLYYYIVGVIVFCFSTRKICLEFDDSNKILKVYFSHILGGGKEQNIAFNNLVYKEQYPDFFTVLMQKSDLVIYDKIGKKVEINNLEIIDNSNLLSKKLSEISRNN